MCCNHLLKQKLYRPIQATLPNILGLSNNRVPENPQVVHLCPFVPIKTERDKQFQTNPDGGAPVIFRYGLYIHADISFPVIISRYIPIKCLVYMVLYHAAIFVS